MEMLRELFANAGDAYRLKRDYYLLTSCVGFVALGVALLIMSFEHKLLTPLNDILAIVLFIGSIPFVFYVSALCVAGIFGIVMVRLNRFTPDEAWFYASRSRYPSHWYKDYEAKG
ncbi:MAG TPA: hypothetical protein VGI40_13890 [Pirellulaceae bacterium]